MSSSSARTSNQRPFYAAHADAYDLLITDPVEPWVEAVHARLGHSAATILDAGCGTGRHAEALIAKGHRVDLADASAQLLAIAGRRCPTARTHLADLCALRTPSTYDAVTCRGVLNDMVTDTERSTAIRSLAACLEPGGLLILDVREAESSRLRADGVTRSRQVEGLTFTTTTTWNEGLLHVHEEYAGARAATYEFTMRPWTTVELTRRLREAGLRTVEIHPGVGRRTLDRLFVVAS
jgi:2-polyprenyl-3-methyl-5-hydroxy-6-metoxy-1,4-benzoquinol methylase